MLDWLSMAGDAAAIANGDERARVRLAQRGIALVAPGLTPYVGPAMTLISQLTGAPVDTTERTPGASMANVQSRLRNLTSGAVVVLGPRGSGKTTLALRLAQLWRQRTGWPVECVGVYPEDMPTWGEHIGPKRWGRMVETLQAAIEEGINPPPSLTERIMLLDEGGLFAHPLGRRVAIRELEQLMVSLRHLRILMPVVAHLFKHLPEEIASPLLADAILIKQPQADDISADRDEAAPLWEAAIACFRDLRAANWHGRRPHDWAYCHAPGWGYRGPLLHGRYTSGEEA